tara:strand:+ start:921 stop:1901 length:981 start_codon:yes stop_codon:yes gene_type:complete
MEFTRESLGLLKLKDGDINLRGLAKKKGIQLKKGANKKDVINAILSQRAGYDVSRKAPPPPPNMTQAQAKVEIKKRLDIMARERYDRDTLLTTAQERREQVAEYDKIRRATAAFERSEAKREIKEVADRLNAQRNIDIWGDDEDFGEMILSFQEITDENTAFFFGGADKSKEGLAIASLYEDEFQYNQIVEGADDEIDFDEYEKELKVTKQQKINRTKNEERVKRYGRDLRTQPKQFYEEMKEKVTMGEQDDRSKLRKQQEQDAKYARWDMEEKQELLRQNRAKKGLEEPTWEDLEMMDRAKQKKRETAKMWKKAAKQKPRLSKKK